MNHNASYEIISDVASIGSSPDLKNHLRRYREELENQLEEILSWWMQRTPDKQNGGFVGRIDHYNNIYPGAPKGSVLNSRILWTFSSSYIVTGKTEYLETAKRAFDYIIENFIDKDFGGVFWTVDSNGKPLDDKKQVYALAFAVYGLSEYFKSSKNETAKETAIALYHAILDHSYDNRFGGYIEALARDWQQIADLRLSAKDANEKKSMNTHLHLLEAFANLYGIWPDKSLKQKVVELITIFLNRIIDEKTYHLNLFFDEQWRSKSNISSYGHDIEAAWLIQDAAAMIGNESLLEQVKGKSVKMAEAAAKGLDADGGLWYEYDELQKHLVREKHSWPQAEAMIGFFNTWQITGDERFLNRSLDTWKFVQEYILDKNFGEWYWGVNEDHSPMIQEDKVGIWKCPYHNSRACVEIIKRITGLID